MAGQSLMVFPRRPGGLRPTGRRRAAAGIAAACLAAWAAAEAARGGEFIPRSTSAPGSGEASPADFGDVRPTTAEEFAAAAAVLKTLTMAAEHRSLPTLEATLSPALFEDMRRAAGPAWGGPEFFESLAMELKASQPAPGRDVLLLAAVRRDRMVLVFRLAPPPLDAESAEPPMPRLPGERIDLESEPMRTADLLFERDARSGAWRMRNARTEERPMDFLSAAKAAAAAVDIYRWAGFGP